MSWSEPSETDHPASAGSREPAVYTLNRMALIID